MLESLGLLVVHAGASGAPGVKKQESLGLQKLLAGVSVAPGVKRWSVRGSGSCTLEYPGLGRNSAGFSGAVSATQLEPAEFRSVTQLKLRRAVYKCSECKVKCWLEI